jgi:hypothetical protein
MALLPEDPTQAALSDTGKTTGHDYRGLGCVSSRVMRRSYSGQAGDKILLARGYRDGKEVRYGSGPSLVIFRLVVPPL